MTEGDPHDSLDELIRVVGEVFVRAKAGKTGAAMLSVDPGNGLVLPHPVVDAKVLLVPEVEMGSLLYLTYDGDRLDVLEPARYPSASRLFRDLATILHLEARRRDELVRDELEELDRLSTGRGFQ